MGVLSPLIWCIIASHLILFICLCLIYIRDELVNLPWQWKYCWYVWCMIIMIFSICFYLFLFLEKIIHLRMINDFFSRQKYVLVRKKVDSADEPNNLWQESSLSLRHNIVHIWGTPTSCQVEIYRKKHLSSDIVFSIRIIFVKGAFTLGWPRLWHIYGCFFHSFCATDLNFGKKIIEEWNDQLYKLWFLQTT